MECGDPALQPYGEFLIASCSRRCVSEVVCCVECSQGRKVRVHRSGDRGSFACSTLGKFKAIPRVESSASASPVESTGPGAARDGHGNTTVQEPVVCYAIWAGTVRFVRLRGGGHALSPSVTVRRLPLLDVSLSAQMVWFHAYHKRSTMAFTFPQMSLWGCWRPPPYSRGLCPRLRSRRHY